MRIAVVGNPANGKGLQRDWQILRALLEAWGHDPVGFHYQRDAPPSGAFDLLIFLEVLEPRFLASAPVAWLVPNPEWWEPSRNAELGALDLVLCKTRAAERIFGALVGERAVFVGFESEDRFDPSVPRERRFLHVQGGSAMKGTAPILEAWDRFKIPHDLTLVTSLPPRKVPRRVRVVRRAADAVVRGLQNGHAFHLQPSPYEGYGHSLHEALSVGAAVATVDAPPMNEAPGLAVRIPPSGRAGLRLAGLALVDADGVRAAVEELASLSDPDLVRIADAARAGWHAERLVFRERLRERIEDAAATASRTNRRHAVHVQSGPRLAICLPCHADPLAAEMLRRSVYSLRAQTADPDLFEVVVAMDGGDEDDWLRKAAAPGSHPFLVTMVESPRPRGAYVPHRNHARNAAWRAATAPLCWMLDADFTPEPSAVEHILAEHDRAIAQGKPAVLTTCLAGWGGVGPADWLRRTDAWAEDGGADGFRALLADWPEIDAGIYSGFPELYRPGEAASKPLPDLPEGMPVVWRELLNTMGGFDESFGEWGADKEEFIDRLKGFVRAGLFEIRIVTSTRALHQPHDRDPGSGDPAAKRRQHERARRLRLITSNAAWWRPQVDAARATMPHAIAATGARGPDTAGVRIAVDGGGLDDEDASEVTAEIVRQMAAKSRREPGPVTVMGRWRPQVVAALDRAGIGCAPQGQDAQGARRLVVCDAFEHLEDPALADAAREIRRMAQGGLFVLAERTRLGPRHGGVDIPRTLRAPLAYQRAFPGLGVIGTREVAGRHYTLFAGRLVR